MRTLSTGDILALLVIALILIGSVPAACWQIRRARREGSRRDQIIRDAHAAPGEDRGGRP